MQLSERPLITEQSIRARTAELAGAISRDYTRRNLLLVPVLKGGAVFAADLARLLTVPCTIDYIRARSYTGHLSRGTVEFTLLPELPLAGQHVVIVEDILDTGRTTAAIIDRIEAAAAASIEVCVLLDKPARRTLTVDAKYVGFSIEDHFVAGYGLDYKERYRHLPAIYTLTPDGNA